ncbi:MAG: 3-chlorobenzoate-3,4-dioxygenase dehydrogenase [Pirellulaceae bacterium]|nr:MAG: 3-chlorobenzoate-3,4-dioxygenase dehydrogenase [Pirellulaceae bacterium]
MAPSYRVAVIGHTGRGNYGHGIDTVWRDLPECRVVAVADPDPQGRKQAVARLGDVRAFDDYRAMLDEVKPDIVAICPRWIDQHCAMVLAAAERGCHIYMEKPMCRDLAEADQMVEACRRHRVKLALAHQTRYSPRLHVVREMIADGAIGEVVELRGRGKEDSRGGAEDLWVLGSHVFNLMHVLAGEPLWCFATVQQGERPATLQDLRPGNEGIRWLLGDRLQAMYGLAGGATAYFGSRKNGQGNRFGLQIFGTKGIIEILTGYLPAVYYLPDPHWSPGRSGARWIPVSSQGPGKPEPLADGGLHAGNVLACRDLLAAIQEDREPECNVLEGRVTIEMIQAVFASHLKNAPVKIPLEERRDPLDVAKNS